MEDEVNKGGAPLGNKNAQKFTLEEWIDKFEEVYMYANVEGYTSLQQAFIKNNIRPSTYKWLVNKYVELDNIKNDIADSIIAVLTQEALTGGYKETMSIFRCKVLGDVVVERVDQTTGGDKIDNKITVDIVYPKGKG